MSDSTTMPIGLIMISNPVFKCYAFYSSILILKMISMSVITALLRLKNKAFVNPEDLKFNRNAEIKQDDPDIERVRRAHLNDMENIFLFLITGLLLVSSNPPEMLANNLFRMYTFVRIMHTIAYVFGLPQPTRTICFLLGVFINIIMVIYIILHMHHF